MNRHAAQAPERILRFLLGLTLGIHYEPDKDLVAVTNAGGSLLHPDDFDNIVELAWKFYDTIEVHGLPGGMSWARHVDLCEPDWWGSIRAGDGEGHTPAEENMRQTNPPPRPPNTWIYFIQAGDDGPIKIGITKNVESRREGLQSGSPIVLSLLCAIPGTRANERMLHTHFADDRLHGEWFNPHPELLEYIEGLHERK